MPGTGTTLRGFTFDRKALKKYVEDAETQHDSLDAAWSALAAASPQFAEYHWYTCRPGAGERERSVSIRSTGYLAARGTASSWSLVCADDTGGPLDGDWALVLDAGGGVPSELLVVSDYEYRFERVKAKRWREPAAVWTPMARPSLAPNSPWERLWGPGGGAWRDFNTFTGVFAPDVLVRMVFRETPMVVGSVEAFLAFARLEERGACPPIGTLVVDPAAESWTEDDAFGAVVGSGLVRTWSVAANGWHTSLWDRHPKLCAVAPVVYGRAV